MACVADDRFEIFGGQQIQRLLRLWTQNAFLVVDAVSPPRFPNWIERGEDTASTVGLQGIDPINKKTLAGR